MELFFASEIKDKIISLSQEESHHVSRVLRMQAGESIAVTDGKGLLADGIISHIGHKNVEVEIKSVSIQQKNFPILHLYVSPTRTTERTEWLIEKATELGCASIYFILCHRTARKNVNLSRYEKIAIAAAKQSLNCYFPDIKILNKSEEAFRSAKGVKLIASCFGDKRLNPPFWPTKAAEYSLFIGPEGDFSTDEVENALREGCLPVSLGNLRLRTETAAIAGISYLRFKGV